MPARKSPSSMLVTDNSKKLHKAFLSGDHLLTGELIRLVLDKGNGLEFILGGVLVPAL